MVTQPVPARKQWTRPRITQPGPAVGAAASCLTSSSPYPLSMSPYQSFHETRCWVAVYDIGVESDRQVEHVAVVFHLPLPPPGRHSAFPEGLSAGSVRGAAAPADCWRSARERNKPPRMSGRERHAAPPLCAAAPAALPIHSQAAGDLRR